MEYAVIKINGKQYIVEESSRLKIDAVTLSTPVEVLGYGTESEFEIGSGKSVELEIIETKKDKKLLVRRYKSKSRYRKEKGHRQPVSLLKVNKIKKGGDSKIVEKSLEVEEVKKEVKKTKVKKSVTK